MRQGEDEMKVAAWKQLGFSVIEPLLFDQALALRAVSIPA